MVTGPFNQHVFGLATTLSTARCSYSYAEHRNLSASSIYRRFERTNLLLVLE
jgi:malate/lactate dehydrogenase